MGMKKITGSRWGWGNFALGLALTGLFVAAEAKDLVLAEIHPPGHIIVKAEELFASRLAELTNGGLAIDIKHSAQLGNEGKSWENVRNGAVDVVRINLGGMVKDIQAARLLSLPYLFRSREHMWRVLGGDFGNRVRRRSRRPAPSCWLTTTAARARSTQPKSRSRSALTSMACASGYRTRRSTRI